MSYDTVEGIHYIFDRYAFINQIMADGGFPVRISESSDKAEISKAFGHARGMYHPDRQARTGEEMRKKAEQKTLLIGDCERFLNNPELKSFYDAKLAEFRENTPHLVSKDGTAMIDLSRTFFDISALLSDKVVDTSGFEAQVKSMLQYDESRVEQAKSLFDMLPDNPKVQGVYRDALTQKYVYLTLLEDSAWAKVGYMNRKEKEEGFLASPKDYTKRIEAALQKSAARDIESTVERNGEIARLGMARTPLMLDAVEGTMPTAVNEQTAPEQYEGLMVKFKEVARKNFEIRAEYVRDVAKQKQEVLETLCTLSPTEELMTPDLAKDTVVDFILLNPPEDGQQKALFRMFLDTATGNAGIAETYKGETLADIKTAGVPRGTFAITRNPEISDIMVEAGAAAERYLDKVEAAKPKAEQTPKQKIRKPKAPKAPGQ